MSSEDVAVVRVQFNDEWIVRFHVRLALRLRRPAPPSSPSHPPSHFSCTAAVIATNIFAYHQSVLVPLFLAAALSISRLLSRPQLIKSRNTGEHHEGAQQQRGFTLLLGGGKQQRCTTQTCSG